MDLHIFEAVGPVLAIAWVVVILGGAAFAMWRS